MRPWLLALAAIAACGPWPGWDPHPVAVLGLCVGFLLLARPRGPAWLPWLAVAAALAAVWLPRSLATDREELRDGFLAHRREMVSTAEELADDRLLVRLLGAAGEAVDPARPFEVLERAARGHAGRTVFLADDRGQIVAWGGDSNPRPAGVRPLGQRAWGVSWSAGGADLWLREPLLQQGRLIGTLLVSDRSPLEARRIWGMEAAPGERVGIGSHLSNATTVVLSESRGLAVPVTVLGPQSDHEPAWRWSGWLVLALLAVGSAPGLSWLVVAVGGLSLLATAGMPRAAAFGVVVLLAGAALGRTARLLPPAWARVVVIGAIASAVLTAVLAVPASSFQWLPSHLLRPGLGGIWMVALAWVAAAWPGSPHHGPGLDRRLITAAVLAVLGLMAMLARIPVDLERAVDGAAGIVLPRQAPAAESILPAPPEEVWLHDLAPELAERWHLEAWARPSQVLVLDDLGREVSRWGDLSAAGTAVRTFRSWQLQPLAGWTVELRTAVEPWSWLRDWGEPADEGSRTLWYAVLTRSGEVAASLHPEISGIGAVTAGELYHAAGGWAWMRIGEDRRLARIRRHDQWLVAVVSPQPATWDWVVRTAIAALWALLGSVLARPPIISQGQLSTFGGRLRLLVAGGVVVPLVILTLFLHQRISSREAELVQTRGLEALRAARYTATHLAGGFAVDDELARWLAAGWGGQVVLWDGIDVVAASRPDLVTTGRLPGLPLPATYPAYLLGREDSVVRRYGRWVVAGGPVHMQDRQLLLHLFLSRSRRVGSDLSAVDWLLTGAFLSALLALVMTTRIQQRLSSSLGDLVALARRLVEGQPVERLRRPPESDLAEVLDAVSTMNEQVQQRELSLRNQEELLRITLETLEPAVIVLEADGSRRFANDSARALEDHHGPLLAEQLEGLLAEVADGGGTAKSVQPVPGRDLTWQMAVAEVPLPDRDRGFVAVVEDVTGLVRADRARQLNELARIVAHEVKNPLTPVRLWVQELEAALARRDPGLQSLTAEACREIAVQVERLQETANSFSNLVALEEWRPEPVDLVPLVAASPGSREVFDRRGIRIRHEISSPPPPPVIGDRHWLRRAIDNLVQNSVDALGDGPGWVRLTLSDAPGWVVLEVEDSGGGVPDERLADLFAPHFSTTNSGSGLGLALVHQVVTRCQGRVGAENGAEGLRVRVELPKRAAAGGAAAIFADPEMS